MDLSKVEEYGQLTTNQWIALGNKLGGLETVKSILLSELTPEIKRCTRVLIDSHGRRIPDGLRIPVCDADYKRAYIEQPDMSAGMESYDARTRQLLHSGVATVAPGNLMREVELLAMLIRVNPVVSNILKGVWLPLSLPKLGTGAETGEDLGEALDCYLRAINASCLRKFKGEISFLRHRVAPLSGKVSIFPGTRQERIIEKMRENCVVGILFPTALQGFSVDAQRKQIASLPEGFSLAGVEMAIAAVMYPDVLFRDTRTSGLDLSALHMIGHKTSWAIKRYEIGSGHQSIGLDSNAETHTAYPDFSGGLFFHM
jgi:hypothetical protein